MTFTDFTLDERLLSALLKLEFKEPTPIQAQAIPLILLKKDLLGIAQTGTGKTGAFGIPLIDRLVKNPVSEKHGVRALILAPTRELCLQIHESLRSFAQDTTLKICAIYGGVDQAEQVRFLRSGVDVVVATPGRLLDLLGQNVLCLSQIEIFVMDEADRMLDMGFIDDIQEIIARLPKEKQSLLFSATMPDKIKELAKRILKSPETIKVTQGVTLPEKITQRLIYCKRDEKFQLLRKLLQEKDRGLTLVFTRTKNLADQVVEYLAQKRLASRALHGDKSQSEREKALLDLTQGSIKVLVATDIASRGIDIEGVTHVINFNLPLEAETYVHRIGRTARAGESGTAISLCEDSEKELLERIQQFIGMYLKSEKYQGTPEVLKLGRKRVTAPTPGKSQEKTAYLDQSKRQRPLQEGEKRSHPGFKKKKKRKK